jgi:two-component system, sensor histidine kinase
MLEASLHPREAARTAALDATGLLDSSQEQAFDDLVSLAATLMQTPIALISLVDKDRQWFKARIGLEATQTPRRFAFCAHAILNADQPFVVEDASLDVRFADNPLVCGAPNVRFYAGIPLKDPETQLPLGTLCTISDQPRRIEADDLLPLRALARQVEHLFSLLLRNRDLAAANQKLIEANQRVERETEEKGRFLAEMSHEIRTPMNGIIGTADLLADEIPAAFREQLATIRACSTSLLYLINDVLDLSKVEAGHLEIHPTPVSVPQLVHDALAVVSSIAASKGLTLSHQAQGCADSAMLDGPRLHQILLNLLSNAIKFTPFGRIFVSTDLTPSQLTVTVKDEGPGLCEADQARIFDAFVQTKTGVRAGGGTGLGLTICRALARAMAGDIRVRSTPGQGSEFSLVIPTSLAVAVKAHSISNPTRDLSGLRVLLAEDNEVNIKVALGMLNRLGITQVRVATNGEEAVAAHGDADLILMDCHMPVLDGLNATREIRRQEASGARKPIIALTAAAFASDRRACLSAGMDAVLTKPLRRETLAQTLSEYAPRR